MLCARRLTPVTADRLIAAGLAIWALFDVPWWWRPPGHGGSNLAIAGLVALAAAAVGAVPVAAPAAGRRARRDRGRARYEVRGAPEPVVGERRGARRRLRARRVRQPDPAGWRSASWWRWPSLAAIVTLQAIEGNHTTAIACALFAHRPGRRRDHGRAPGPRHQPGQAGLRRGTGQPGSRGARRGRTPAQRHRGAGRRCQVRSCRRSAGRRDRDSHDRTGRSRGTRRAERARPPDAADRRRRAPRPWPARP